MKVDRPKSDASSFLFEFWSSKFEGREEEKQQGNNSKWVTIIFLGFLSEIPIFLNFRNSQSQSVVQWIDQLGVPASVC